MTILVLPGLFLLLPVGNYFGWNTRGGVNWISKLFETIWYFSVRCNSVSQTGSLFEFTESEQLHETVNRIKNQFRTQSSNNTIQYSKQIYQYFITLYRIDYSKSGSSSVKHTELERIKKPSKLVNCYSESVSVIQSLSFSRILLEQETDIKLRLNSE